MTSPTNNSSAFRLDVNFHDISNADYDQIISKKKDQINSTGTSNTQKCIILEGLIQELKNKKAEYSPRPCGEGSCFGLVIPHRSRLERRIVTLETNLKTCRHLESIERQDQKDSEKYRREELLKKMESDAQLQAKKMELDAYLQATHHTTTTTTQKGVFPKN